MKNKNYVAHIGTCGGLTEVTVHIKRAWKNHVKLGWVIVKNNFNPYGDTLLLGSYAANIYLIMYDKCPKTIFLSGTNYRNIVVEHKVAF